MTDSNGISELRRSIVDKSMDRQDLHDDPIVQFERWFGDACDVVALEPNGAALSTVGADLRPSSRTVLLKYFDRSGFVFFTNYKSKKAREIDENSHVSLLFFWRELGRQISIDGRAEKIPKRETLKYFTTRPRGSQIGAWVSEQSNIVSSRALLESKFEEMKRKFANREVPLPSFWGGYRVVPDRYEFWQGRQNRLHDRFEYRQVTGGAWQIERLAP